MVEITSVAQLGKIVRQARKEVGISQEQLATVAGVGARFLGELENGKETVQLGLVFKVLDVLGLTLAFPYTNLSLSDDK